MNIHIKNGHLIDPKNSIDAQQDVYVSAGLIAGIGKAPSGFVADTTIDASHLVVCPGFVDLSARLREPGANYHATLNSELKAATAGGITSLACSPDTKPILDEPGLVEMLKYRAKQLNLANVYPLGALTQQLQGALLTEMYTLQQAGCIGFSQADAAIIDTQVLWRAFEYAASFGFTLFLRAEEPFLAKNGVAHDGEVASRLGLKGIPAAAESLAIASMLRIAKITQTRIHLCRLSTADGVDLVRQAKQQGVQVTADVSIQHCHLSDFDIGFFNTQAKLKPPLRSLRDQEALCQGLKDGTIDAICSDHTPVDADAKLLPFAEAEAGASALTLLLPLALKWANQHQASVSSAIDKISHQAARSLGVAAGHLSLGAAADIAIIDPLAEWIVTKDSLVSEGKNSPFLGLPMQGQVQYTLFNGNIVYQISPTK